MSLDVRKAARKESIPQADNQLFKTRRNLYSKRLGVLLGQALPRAGAMASHEHGRVVDDLDDSPNVLKPPSRDKLERSRSCLRFTEQQCRRFWHTVLLQQEEEEEEEEEAKLGRYCGS